MTTRSLCIIALIFICIACERKPRFEDKIQVKIADLQDRRDTDSLRIYLSNKNSLYQSAAVYAFGSVQDTSVIAELGKINGDRMLLRNVAFALGQTNSPMSITLLKSFARDHKDDLIRSEAFEALGKVVDMNNLDAFYLPSKGASLHEGITWGVYRAGLRGVVMQNSIDVAALTLEDKNETTATRLGAAHFFARASFTPNEDVVNALSKGAAASDPEVRMASVSALAKVDPATAIEAIAKAVKDPDYRVRVNAARSLRMQPWNVAKPHFDALFADSNVHVTIAAAEVFGQIRQLTDSVALLGWARTAKNWRTQATLYEILLKLSKSKGNNQEIIDLYNSSRNPYQQAALLSALSQGPNADFIFQQFKSNDTKIVKSTAASALARTNRQGYLTSEAALPMYEEIVSDGDQGALIYTCEVLRDTTLHFKELIKDFAFLEEAKAKLSLPRDYETYVPLERVLNYFKDLPDPPTLKNEFNHPIDWTLAATIKQDQKVVIQTTKGNVVMQLFIEEAPGSVVNFVKLVTDKYFDGKFFHRVVPNFVVQTGCDRGDGFGSLDYSIRSEFSPRKYKTGSVGMASAGKDTEATQWFITHSPTPHLDGKYTIFAEVIEGMEVVHKIEVGDQIISARLME